MRKEKLLKYLLKKLSTPNKGMEAASNGVRVLLSVLSDEQDVGGSLVKFTRQLEEDYAEVQDITLYIFALRCFFCWHRIHELTDCPEKVNAVRAAWIEDNDASYTRWLSSANDSHDQLKWAKWVFQAKNSILTENLVKK
jgi:hypothetical protein